MSSNPATGGIKVKIDIFLRGTAITSEPMRINTLKFTCTFMTRITHIEQLLKFQTGIKPQKVMK